MLPVDAIHDAFVSHTGPVVVTAPPGSGKSTRVPLWCAAPVLVVQPRRVAARSLAQHLREAGEDVGFAVRGASERLDAPVVFVTPGVALRMLADDPARFATVVLDEFHERSLDLDLLLALVHARGGDPELSVRGSRGGAEVRDVGAPRAPRLVVLSATLDGDRLADHLGGTHLQAAGRLHPVEVRYTHADRTLPSEDRLGERVAQALRSLEGVPGDRLVFVPGKAELREVVAAVDGGAHEVVALHGGLSLKDQARVFRPGERRRVVVATNVAETSVTLPRIGAVVDSGLVRRTHYHQDRGYLQLGPIAADSAEQRAGRAGRLGPGVAVRLWGERAPLQTFTPPAVQRESLVPLVLAAAAAGYPALDLPFVDPPPEHAVRTARDELTALGALEDRAITARGRRLFQLPMDPHIAHLLVVAEQRDALAAAIDLAAALGTSRPLFVRPMREDDDEDPRRHGDDVRALITAVRSGDARRDGLAGHVLADVRREVARLRASFGDPPRRPYDRLAMAAVLAEAWPRSAHVARRRKRVVRWSNGGTEVALGRSSCVPDDREALLAVDFRAVGRDRLNRELIVTVALPMTLSELGDLGLGRPRAGETTVERRRGGVRIETVVEWVYAGAVVRREATSPTGALAHEVIAERLLAGQVWRGFHVRFAERARLVGLQRALDRADPLPEPVDFLRARLATVGLESVDDLALLEEEDLLPGPLEPDVAASLAADFPAEWTVGALRFRVDVHPKARTVVLHNLGARLKKPPPTGWLPAFRGFAVVVEDRGKRRTLRG